MARALPAGVVTFLFTDIEGSTRLLHELGDRYADALHEHRRVLRLAFAEHNGVEVDTQGDAFLVAFGRASDAVAAAEAGQRPQRSRGSGSSGCCSTTSARRGRPSRTAWRSRGDSVRCWRPTP